jgi:N-acetylneuraminic acid mutarotase
MTVRRWCLSTIPLLGLAALVTCASAVYASTDPAGRRTPQAVSWSARGADDIQPHRIGASTIYDETQNRLIVFGGASGAFLNDTWAYSLSSRQWSRLATTGTPPSPRQWHVTALTPDRKMIVYGGYDGRILSDTYSLDLATLTWTKIVPSTRGLPAPRRYLHSATLAVGSTLAGTALPDTTLYIFGGTDGDSLQNDVYSLVLGSPDSRKKYTWNRFATTATTRPSRRQASGLIYSAADTSLAIFGGFDGTKYLNDVWSLSLTRGEWAKVTPATGSLIPSVRGGHAMVFDQSSRTLLVYGGWNGMQYYGDAWSISLSTLTGNAWTQLATSGPEARFYPAFTFGAGGLLIACGGGVGGALGDVWNLPAGAGAWQPLSPGTALPPRYGHVGVYDTQRARAVVFGGYSSYNQLLNDTWAYDPASQAWTQLVPPDTIATATARAAAVYVPEEDNIYVFGGWTGGYSNTLWSFAPSTNRWTRVNLPRGAAVPPGRESASLVYDAANGRLLLFGGFSGEFQTDLWSFDLASRSWSSLPALPGSGRYGHVAGLDASGRLIVALGANLNGVLAEIRIFTPASGDPTTGSWSAPVVTGTITPGRIWAAAFVEATTNRLVVFGGAGPSSSSVVPLLPVAYGDVWTLDLGTFTWTSETATAVTPRARFSSAAVFVPGTSTALLIGGADGASTLNDTWLLSLNAGPGPSASSQLVEDGRVVVRWQMFAPTAAGYSVLRSRAGAPESEQLIAELAPQAASNGEWLEAEDRAIVSGATYRYSVLDLSSGLRVSAGEVTVPDAVAVGAVALRFVLRSPSAPPVRVALFSASRGVAMKEPAAGVFDVMGRIVRRVDLQPDGDARWSAVWDGRDALGHSAPSGVYLVRGLGAAEAAPPARVALMR